MISLMENKAGKNLHLEHIEDEILNFGVPGGRAAIRGLRLHGEPPSVPVPSRARRVAGLSTIAAS